MKQGLTSGQVAQQADVNVETLRYYERRQLLARPPRSSGGFRLYPAGAIGQVRFIKRAQALGFTLEEIQELLKLGSRGGKCGDVKQRVDGKIAAIDEKIADLKGMRASLVALAASCNDPAKACPVLVSLDLPPGGAR